MAAVVLHNAVIRRGIEIDGGLGGQRVEGSAPVGEPLATDGDAESGAEPIVRYRKGEVVAVAIGVLLPEAGAEGVLHLLAMAVVGVAGVGDGGEGINLRGKQQRVGVVEVVVAALGRVLDEVTAEHHVVPPAQLLLVGKVCHPPGVLVADVVGVDRRYSL